MLRGLTWVLLLTACSREPVSTTELQAFPTPFSSNAAPPNGESAFAPLPLTLEPKLDARKVALGERLYVDPRLSGDGKVTCAHCHSLTQGGANGQARSLLPGRKPVGVNVPSIFNAAFFFRFAWSGRFADIAQQLDAAMESPAAMGGTFKHAAEVLHGDAEVAMAFAAVYPEGITAESVREVIALYTLSLITPNSRFDRYLRAELALKPDEQQGYELFRSYGCVSCHQGINVGGNMVQRFGVMRDYFADRGNIKPADLGLYAATKREEDRYVFRVPSLRNVALTAPYFHDASAATLPEAVTTMARYQLGRELDEKQKSQLVAFLGTLTGELHGRPL
jgi:cytochrome c peroxidase